MELLDQIETYLAQHRIPPSKFGRLAVGDPRFVDDLRGGRMPRARTCERVRTYLQRNIRQGDEQMQTQGTPLLSPSRRPSLHWLR